MSMQLIQPVRFVTGLANKVIVGRIWFRILRLALREYRSPGSLRRAMAGLRELKVKFAGTSSFSKIIRSQGKYYWHMHLPGFPSELFDRHFLGALNRFAPVRSPANRLTILYFGLTKKCPLKCRHCYDWPDLNREETLSLADLQQIGATFQENGVSQIHFLGGEPMARFADLLSLVKAFSPRSEVWFSTSGYRLDAGKALELRDAGLTGVAISIDHFDPDRHNEIRGHPEAFRWAMQATESCTAAGLLTCWSLVVSKEFVTRQNLMTYAEAAARNRVNFIQIFEPMAVGRFQGQDIKIDEHGIKVLEGFFLEMNRNPRYKNYPVVVYTGYHQRRIGCMGRADRFLYVDNDGNLHPCPFCRSEQKTGILHGSFEECLNTVKQEKCRYEYQ
jgi:MoaA/NifB/PqqE/SkfB family radical SAM enzyme